MELAALLAWGCTVKSSYGYDLQTHSRHLDEQSSEARECASPQGSYPRTMLGQGACWILRFLCRSFHPVWELEL